MNKKMILSVMLLGVMTLAKAQLDMPSILEGQTDNVTGSANVIANWILGIMGVVSLYQLIMAWSSGQGDQKVQKIALWLFCLVATGVGFIVSTGVFAQLTSA